MKPDKMILMGGPVKTAHVISGSMRIVIEHSPHSDPAFDGVYVRIETFVANGTTDKVFYPYAKPVERPTQSDLWPHPPDNFEPHIGEWLKWMEEHPEQVIGSLRRLAATYKAYKL